MRTTRILTRAGLTLLAGTAVLAAGAPAQAASTGSASVKGTEISFTVVVTRSGRTVTIDDKYAIKPGKGCKRVDATKVRCTTAKAPTRIKVLLGTRNDRFVNKTAIQSWVDGQSGNDAITGGSGKDSLDGGTGNDAISGGYGDDDISGWTGNDRLYGGSGRDWIDGWTGNDKLYGGTYGDHLQGGLGNDLLDGGTGNDYLAGENEDRGLAGSFPVGADVFRGGAGVDTVTYTFHNGVTVDLDGQSGDDGAPGEHDTVGTDIEILEGSVGNDTLIGNAAANTILGDRGDDTIRGGGGNDTMVGDYGVDKLYGEAGDDTIDAIELSDPQDADQVDGGDNATSLGDLCKAAPVDVVVNCER
ncbi:calcium-binding protein [Actinoplanes awajinensis]|uniref:Calcium-binding protein n=1 Tax=Actinoplanes awajinensis subsp. mycoplanecinus TaxID=135947 RepID=A0A0X3UPU6_9ACTN|nr:calcium-binding protein [Actinoplanes awajinensis]KUL34621.1 hypothetical protein ADL15_16280 [Actinoplanes awajinensis subsp. mycoplanecinus]